MTISQNLSKTLLLELFFMCEDTRTCIYVYLCIYLHALVSLSLSVCATMYSAFQLVYVRCKGVKLGRKGEKTQRRATHPLYVSQRRKNVLTRARLGRWWSKVELAPTETHKQAHTFLIFRLFIVSGFFLHVCVLVLMNIVPFSAASRFPFALLAGLFTIPFYLYHVRVCVSVGVRESLMVSFYVPL